MENITFNLAQMHQYGSAFYDFLGLRKRFFVDQLGWDIPHDGTVEMDQYDNPLAYYSLVLRDGKVIGGARAMATTAQWGSHTYMLRDAVAGKLIGIPENIIKQPMVEKTVWECTRVVISDEVDTHADRSLCLSYIVDGLVDQATEHGATEMMALCPPSFARALRKLGYGANLIGQPYVNSDDGRRYVAMSMPAKRREVRTANLAPSPRPTHIPHTQPVHAQPVA
ncbi:acyl homoserine lactone synthase [Yoonia sediminilitoris]|uniref:Acyl-homoserine-lactone synthase n=2 Tax=Yoonia sediminilitoris TaxID=1286148 RepID=A0A2T6KDU0_9RHOB|nr:acyl homoserine lactone synthase [Yoonia sediminilitoris]RCW94506.1 acyl homoserine lactone synthase [Yoonia sediminilitoris]